MDDEASKLQARHAAREVAAQVLLRHKMDQWQECMNGPDRHAIWSQIVNLLWDAAVFRIVVRARSLAQRDGQGEILLNVPMHRMLDVGFFQGQVLAIRRITDPGERDFDHPKAVSSLRWLVGDMKAHRALLTRENLFGIAALPIDESVAAAAESEIIRRVLDSGETGAWIPPSADSDRVRELHALIDQLTGATPTNRTPDDVVSLGFFQGLESKLSKLTAIRHFADKFVAHASSPSNRQQSTVKDASIQLSQIEEAHEILCRCFNAMGQVVQASPLQHRFLPTPFTPPEALLDQALIATKELPKLAETWEEFENVTSQWGLTDLKWVTS